MALTLSGDGTITGLAVGGLPDGTVDSGTLATDSVTSANIADGTITTDDILASDVVSLKSGRKNLIINGGFDVWQRGTTSSGGVAGTFTADRWAHWAGDLAVSKQFDTTYGNFVRVRGNTTSPAYFTHRVELPELYQNKTITLSFFAKASTNIAVNQKVRVAHAGGDYDRDTVASFALTTSWQKFSYTIDVNGGAYSYNSSSYLEFQVISNVNMNAVDIDIAQVQAELGSVATDFEHRSYGEELALCQRYYYSEDFTPYNVGFAFNTTQITVNAIKFPVAMRVVPTITAIKPSHISTQGNWGIYYATNGWSTGYTPNFDSRTTQYIAPQFSGVGGVTNGSSYICNGWFSASAELY